MRRYCLTLDLKKDQKLIDEYEKYHQSVWPEILKSITDSGISNMEIWRVETRLFMIMDVEKEFSLEAKAIADKANNKVQEWELLMDKYQERLPFAAPGEKWVLMDQIFTL